MHDLKELLRNAGTAVPALARRGFSLDLQQLEELSNRRTSLIRSIDEDRVEAKKVAAEAKEAAEEERQQLRNRARELRTRTRDREKSLHELESELREIMLKIPNLPDERVPNGDSDEFAEAIDYEGVLRDFDFTPKSHAELGRGLGILDLEAATAMSGPRFAVMSGPGAKLERALIDLFISIHTEQFGYVEKSVPVLVTRDSMTATGQLPKFERDLFKTQVGDRDLFLAPTGEVPLTNLYANSVLEEAVLPSAVTAHTQCFRSEAGSYGRDTHGLIRLHQFSKVELVRLCKRQDTDAELDRLIEAARACLRALELPHRVVRLAAGDTGFAAEMTYDLEVWLPAQSKYREISSCSSFGEFQGRRANIRYRTATGSRRPVTTLNGSGLPIGRTIAALLENFQRRDGSVALPGALIPYMGATEIAPATSDMGSTSNE